MASLTIDMDTFKAAAQVTAAFLIFYMGCLVFQGMSKLKIKAMRAAKKERFDRFNDPLMLPQDRLVGNLLEWMPIFLGLFWMSMVLTEGKTVVYGWVYVAARVLYAVLALSGGIITAGVHKKILLATVPAYVVLMILAVSVVTATL